jgi:hypoxanthine phosphoribosyltransferase
MEYYSVSWKELQHTTYLLSQKISNDNKKYDLIVGIARGGLTVAHIASDFLKLPVASFTISSYKDLKQQELAEISFHVGGDLKNKNILLVDDCSDSGKTFIRGSEYLLELGASKVGTAAPFIKPWTKHFPNYYVVDVDKWIVWPFDVRETIEDLQNVLRKENKTDEFIKKQLIELNIPLEYITKYLKTK